MLYEVRFNGSSSIEFRTREEAEAFKNRHVEAMKTYAGDKYLNDIEIIEKWGFNV